MVVWWCVVWLVRILCVVWGCFCWWCVMFCCLCWCFVFGLLVVLGSLVVYWIICRLCGWCFRVVWCFMVFVFWGGWCLVGWCFFLVFLVFCCGSWWVELGWGFVVRFLVVRVGIFVCWRSSWFCVVVWVGFCCWGSVVCCWGFLLVFFWLCSVWCLLSRGFYIW